MGTVEQAAMPAEPEPRSNLVTAPLGRWTCDSDPQITEWLDVLCPSLEPGRMSIYVRGREAFCDPSKAGAGARTLMVDIAEKANGQWSCGVAGGVPGISVETESVDMVRLRVDWRHARDNRVSLAGHNAEVADELPRRDKLYDLFDEWDLDGDGFLCESELWLLGKARAQSFESNKWVPQPEHARASWSVTKNLRFFGAMDMNGDRQVAPIEFVGFMDETLPSDPVQFNTCMLKLTLAAQEARANGTRKTDGAPRVDIDFNAKPMSTIGVERSHIAIGKQIRDSLPAKGKLWLLSHHDGGQDACWVERYFVLVQNMLTWYDVHTQYSADMQADIYGQCPVDQMEQVVVDPAGCNIDIVTRNGHRYKLKANGEKVAEEWQARLTLTSPPGCLRYANAEPVADIDCEVLGKQLVPAKDQYPHMLSHKEAHPHVASEHRGYSIYKTGVKKAGVQ